MPTIETIQFSRLSCRCRGGGINFSKPSNPEVKRQVQAQPVSAYSSQSNEANF